jgi:hypothetical protein
VQARSRSLTGVLGSVETLSTLPTAYPPEIAIDRGGKAIAAWLVEADDSRDHIQARSLSTAGELGAIWSLPLPRGHLAFDPRISVSAEGDAVITYIHRAGEDRVRGVAAP